MKALKFTFCLLFLHVGVHAQYAVSKLHLAGKEVLEISESDVHIDTLIMDDKSRIVFKMPDTRLVIKNAFIGERCAWDLSGNSGGPVVDSISKGLSGRNLNADVVFRYLGDLKINAAGANGRKVSDRYTFDYGDVAKQGGDGGDGGAVSLTYRTTGFPVTFNDGGIRSIKVDTRGGRGGVGEGRVTQNASSPATPRPSSHTASFDLWGNQRAAAYGDVTPRNSRAQNGGNGDIPQPMYIVSGPEGMVYGNTPSNKARPNRSTVGRKGTLGFPGRVGSFTFQKAD